MFARRSISYEDSAGVRFFLCDLADSNERFFLCGLVDSDERFFLRGLADSDERFFLRGSVDSDECFLLRDLAVLVTVGRFGVNNVQQRCPGASDTRHANSNAEIAGVWE